MAPKFDANFGLMSVLSCCLTMPDLGKELNSYTVHCLKQGIVSLVLLFMSVGCKNLSTHALKLSPLEMLFYPESLFFTVSICVVDC